MGEWGGFRMPSQPTPVRSLPGGSAGRGGAFCARGCDPVVSTPFTQPLRRQVLSVSVDNGLSLPVGACNPISGPYVVPNASARDRTRTRSLLSKIVGMEGN